MIDRQTADKIIDAARIVDVVGEFVTLRKSGVNYKGLCPFHDDKNPSFMVSPAKNICHCFVCGKGGTPAGFLMEHEQMSYPEALRWLARKYNIEIVEKELTDDERREQSERESMLVVNEWAKQYFHDVLSKEPEGVSIGLQYFRMRGIRDDIIEKFQLGYALQNRESMSAAALKAGYREEFLVKTGLCYKRENDGRLVDRYSGRAIFPWFNVSGKVVAFGGRVLDSRTKGVAQKYVNSPESDIYHKERELYGIFQAKRAIVKEDRVFMVEGYTDVIAMHQAGVENVVANSGTALSIHQIRLLHRFTQNITLLYDGDDAGIHAAMRGTDMLLAEGMNVKVLLLPDGDDPDSFARKHSSEELKKYIEEQQTDFITFKTRLTVENVKDPVKRSEGITSIVKSISVIPNPILRSTYITDFSSRIGMKEDMLVNAMNQEIDRLMEEKRKEREREQSSARTAESPDGKGEAQSTETAGTETAPAANQTTNALPSAEGEAAPVRLTPAQNKINTLELLLLREIVRHGEEVIFDSIETDNGGTMSLTVAQYVAYDLSLDGLIMSTPLYNRILSEASSKSTEEGFKAETYFTNHPDLEISRLATRLAIDRHQLGGRFVMAEKENELRQRVVHLMMDYRLRLLEERLKDLQLQMRQSSGDLALVMEMMKEYKETQEVRDILAKKLGSEVR